MMLETLSFLLSWNWPHDGPSSGSAVDRRKSRKKKHVRSRSSGQQVAQNGSAVHGGTFKPSADDDDGYYPGLVNISGTYCFMNSVLQSMASLSYLTPHINSIHSRAEELDVPTPVIDALRDALLALNTPKSSPSSLRPVPMINALSSPTPGRHSTLFSSREHQDAQELFQLLSECIKNEALAVDKEVQRDRGLSGLSGTSGQPMGEAGQNVFDGLTANRRSCMECGYTEAVMHFAFDNWQLAVPRLSASCTLHDCLSDYIRLELLTDCICRKCSMLATQERLKQEAEKLSVSIAADATPSQSKKKRAREARRLEARVKAALEEGRIEEDLKGVKMEKVISKASTKQAMIARPPKVLVLHLNRSVHYGNYAGKNSCRILFPEILDLTPYTTSGQLSTVPSVPISTPSPALPRSTTPTQSTYATPRVLYRLAAVVCHYGAHSFGHYVCFRRKPHRTSNPSNSTLPLHGPATINPPRLACPIGCECAECTVYGPVRDELVPPSTPGKGWLRISDDSVDEVGIERVLGEGVGAFMLFYERVLPFPRPNVYPLACTPRSSEETVRPHEIHVNGLNGLNGMNGSAVSIATFSTLSIGENAEDELVTPPRTLRRASSSSEIAVGQWPGEAPTLDSDAPIPVDRPPLSSETRETPSTPPTEAEAAVESVDEVHAAESEPTTPTMTSSPIPIVNHTSAPISIPEVSRPVQINSPKFNHSSPQPQSPPIRSSPRNFPQRVHHEPHPRGSSPSPSPTRKAPPPARILSPQPLRPPRLSAASAPVRLGLYA
ncbi:cysteine proteinase [Rickenella mellea]|uniref:ubiquitinyl hydrolase 1 n=1 Tax=Rickenella mellea TaxID=50990 RepID=A0A4R5XFL9_9AGAM|nr:cysteine proteinase [Rickenella mellea]